MLKPNFYFYESLVTNVVDGDTIDVRVDLGFRASIEQRLRFYGINAPEIRGEERERGLEAKKFVEEHLLDKEIWIETIKGRTQEQTGKFGRYLAKIYLPWTEDLVPGTGKDFNTSLVEQGHAVYANY